MPDNNEFFSSTLSGEEIQDKRDRSFRGLNRSLWRLALVTGVGQFSISIWWWQFSIFLDDIMELWQLGLTLSIGRLALILAYPLCGIISDLIGRKKAMIFAYIPVSLGLLMMYLFPTWPTLPFFYGLTFFGWGFVLIISRAIPADEIEADQGRDSAKRFTMVLFPVFIIDGLSPALASFLLSSGTTSLQLLIIASIGGLIALIASAIFIQESLSGDIQNRARAGPIISFQGLGRDYWRLAVGMVGFYFAFMMAVPYLGNLAVNEWAIDITTYGLTWSAFSVTNALMIYAFGGLADRAPRASLFIALLANTVIVLAFSIGSGLFLMILLNILWAFPVTVWIGAERALVVQGVGEEQKGRALGTYAVIVESTGLVALMTGALVWDLTGSLRTLWATAGLFAFAAAIIAGIALKGIRQNRLMPIQESS